MLKSLALAFALLCLFTINSEARQRTYAAHPDCNILWPCQDVGPSPRGEMVRKALGGLGSARPVYTPRVGHRSDVRALERGQRTVGRAAEPVPRAERVAAAIVSHPPGCPSRAFCGCGAAVRVFGSPIRSLWLAANWFKFPRATPSAGMVAVRRHHVFVLEADLGGGVWQVFDANSGRGQTRIHARSIAGYAIVNPRAG